MNIMRESDDTAAIFPKAAEVPQGFASSMTAKRLRGEVAYLFAFDVAYDTNRAPLKTLLGQPVEWFALESDKRVPRELFFYRPATVRLPEKPVTTPHGTTPARRTVKFFPVGALSVTIAVPFEVGSLGELIDYHDLRDAQEEARQLAEQVTRDLRDWFIRPVPHMRLDEAYTVFCIDRPSSMLNEGTDSTEAWLTENRRQVAALLTQEHNADSLSQQEVLETTGKYLSYYRHDLTIVDWDAALVIDEPAQFQYVRHIMELANVQLAELEAYDRLLDETMDDAYRNLARSGRGQRNKVLRDLRELRIDMARFSDELSNTTKFFGEWHLARVYQALYDRFHMNQWHRTIDGKLATLDDLYRISKQDQMNNWMMVLEVTIVALFIFDVALILMRE